ALNKWLHGTLPQEMIPHCRVMNVAHQTLILEADSATWATRVRYLTPTLLEQLSDHSIKKIECRVRF
ncbi:MAG TPA: DciA family protein, partial [Gammaproteobacteria bacterium]|nr:DciA family protein [Gammaproteobacteria bacterium]